MNLVPLSNNRIMITLADNGPTALFTCRWKDGDVTADELDRIAEGCRIMAAQLRAGKWCEPEDSSAIEDTFNRSAPPSADP